MNVYVIYPNEKNIEANLSLEKNINKVAATLIKETIKRKEYSDYTKVKVLEELIANVNKICVKT